MMQTFDGSKSEVSIEDPYMPSDEYKEFYETLVAEIAKDIL